MGTIALGRSHCDYNGCFATPTLTDGEFVMCPNHERTAYRLYGGPDIRWRPILRITPNPGDRLPFFTAHY